jgi:hypothetical protein
MDPKMKDYIDNLTEYDRSILYGYLVHDDYFYDFHAFMDRHYKDFLREYMYVLVKGPYTSEVFRILAGDWNLLDDPKHQRDMTKYFHDVWENSSSDELFKDTKKNSYEYKNF